MHTNDAGGVGIKILLSFTMCGLLYVSNPGLLTQKYQSVLLCPNWPPS